MSTKNPRGPGRRRSEVAPYVERGQGRLRYRRKTPEDVAPFIGEWLVHNFDPLTATPEHVSAVSKALTLNHDEMIQKTRERLASLRDK